MLRYGWQGDIDEGCDGSVARRTLRNGWGVVCAARRRAVLLARWSEACGEGERAIETDRARMGVCFRAGPEAAGAFVGIAEVPAGGNAFADKMKRPLKLSDLFCFGAQDERRYNALRICII